MKTQIDRFIAAAFKCSKITVSGTMRSGLSGLLSLALLLTVTGLNAQAKAKKVKAKTAGQVQKAETKVNRPSEEGSAQFADATPRPGATRWSTHGITLGLSGAFVMPRSYIQGAPESFSLGKEYTYSYAAKLSYDYVNIMKLFGAFETFDFKVTGNQNGIEQKYSYAGYKALGGLEITPQGLGRGENVHTGFGFGMVFGGGFYLPTKASVEVGGVSVDRSAFVNRVMGFGRIGARVYYSFSFGVTLGLGYYYDHVSGGVEKSTDTGEQTKQINSHNVLVFMDARILNFGSTTYDK